MSSEMVIQAGKVVPTQVVLFEPEQKMKDRQTSNEMLRQADPTAGSEMSRCTGRR